MHSRTNDLLSFFAAIGLCTGTTVGSVVLYVDDDAPPAGDGQSWATAYRFLQDALDEADDSGGAATEIHVAQGLYRPDRDESNPGGTGEQVETFQLVNGVLLAGGYAGIGAPDPDERDVSGFVTTLSGDLLDDDKGFANIGDNSWHVVTGSDNDPTAIIDGVTITAGNASGPTKVDDTGGGMIAKSGSPTVRNCRFELNHAMAQGGGIDIVDGSPAISGSTFLGNVAEVAGGGIRCFQNSSVTISNCSFIANRAKQSDRGGGGVVNRGSRLDITGSLFLANRAEYEGGAIVSNYSGATTLHNSTVVRNEAVCEGGGLCVAGGGTIDVVNSIIFLNTASSHQQIFVENGNGTVTVSYTNTQGGLGGEGVIDVEGNIMVNPLFVDPDSDDYHLAAGSPSIDTGDLESVTGGVLVDRDGNPRLIDCQVDMGAYEHQTSLFAPGDTNCDGAVDFADVLNMVGSWGECDLCAADTDHDGDVDFADLITLLQNWT